MVAISRTPVSESFSSGSSGAAGKTQSGGGGRKSEPKDCSDWPEVQTIDSLRSLSELATNPPPYSFQFKWGLEQSCIVNNDGADWNSRSLTSV